MLKTTISQLKTSSSPVGLGGEKGWYCPSLSKNGDAGRAFDLSGNANHCTYNGGMVAATKVGKGGSKAYQFLNSGDYVDGLPYYFDQDLTYSGWINVTDLTSDPFYLFGSGNVQTLRVLAGSDPGTWQSIIKAYTPDRVQIASAISSEVWHHVVTVIRGSSHEVWIDGELAGQAAITGTGSDPTLNRLGYGFGGAHGVGYADDVRIYDRALTPSEIKHLSTARGIQGRPKQQIRNRYLPSILIEVLQRVRRGILSFFIDI
jgi:hypothetical protein